MSQSPLPSRIADLLAPGPRGNPALVFDRGVDRYDPEKGWRIPAGGKESFLQAFARAFNSRDPAEYRSFLERRCAALAELKARTFDRTTQTRLVIGLGLPSPLETGFLFDRLTGCPYLPGSSVKGLLRATARLVQDAEIQGDKNFWITANIERIFGPEIEPGKIASKGKAIFHDAFPTTWPMLEADVLTPHYKAYYGDKRKKEVPADWDNPNPVAFLTVKPGTKFQFALQAFEKDAEELEKLLDLGLDWLGIGAKKSAGYGVLGEGGESPTATPPPPQSPAKAQPPEREPAAPPTSPSTVWQNVELLLLQGSVTAKKGRQTATCNRDGVEREVFHALVKHRELRADVEVLKLAEGRYRLVRVENWRAARK